MSASEDLGNVLRVLEGFVGSSQVTMPGDVFDLLYTNLLGIKNDVRELEPSAVPEPARVVGADPRICKEPPWGWGPNVVPMARPAARPQGAFTLPRRQSDAEKDFARALHGARFDERPGSDGAGLPADCERQP